MKADRLHGYGLVGTGDAAAAIGGSVRQVDWWIRKGLIVPFVPAKGSGTVVGLSQLNVGQLAVARLISLIVRETVQAEAIRFAADAVRQAWPTMPEDLWIDQLGYVWTDRPPARGPMACIPCASPVAEALRRAANDAASRMN